MEHLLTLNYWVTLSIICLWSYYLYKIITAYELIGLNGCTLFSVKLAGVNWVELLIVVCV